MNNTRKPKSRLTSETKQLIALLYIAGHTVKSLANDYDLTVDTVYKVLRKYNVPLRPTCVGCTGHRLTDEEKENLAADYDNGMKVMDICKKYNLSTRGLYLNINKDKYRHTGQKPADMKKYYLAKAREYQKKQITQQYIYTSSYGTDIKGFDSEIAMKVFAIKQLYKAVMEIPEEMAIDA